MHEDTKSTTKAEEWFTNYDNSLVMPVYYQLFEEGKTDPSLPEDVAIDIATTTWEDLTWLDIKEPSND